MNSNSTVPNFALLDQEDELSSFRKEFYLQPGVLYLDGNSLGLLSKRAEAATLRILNEWKTLGVDGWLQGVPPWFEMAEKLGAGVSPLLGADPASVIVTNSTTVNLHQLLSTLYRPYSTLMNEIGERTTSGRSELLPPKSRLEYRSVLLADALNFSSDLFALQSHLRLRGLDPNTHLKLVPGRTPYLLEESDIVEAMTEEVQLALLPSVLYRSGQVLDMEFLTREAHRRGILIGFDCSHSIGAMPHKFDDWGVDFACWCHYKHLNGGPGGAGGLYLNKRHFGISPGLAGWFSSRKDRQFDLTQSLTQAEDAGALQIGTPNILSMAALEGSLEIFALAGIEKVRKKSLALTDYLMRRISEEFAESVFEFASPIEPERRGGHIALRHPEAIRICKALKELNVIPDFRPPDLLRVAPIALYTSFAECEEFVQRLKRIMELSLYKNYADGREIVA